jgi:hypothetical protein
VFEPRTAELFFLPTFGLNLAIQWIICPVLIKRLSPKLKNSGIYSGSFREWRKHRRSMHDGK